MRAEHVGDRVGPWVVLDTVGLTEPRRYKAAHVDQPGRIVLLEVVRRSPPAEARLRRALHALRLLDHPNLPKFVDFGDEDQRLWLAVEWFEGESLADRLLSGPMDWRDACRAFFQLSHALAHVHAHSLVHRDVNPSNVYLAADGTVRLAGFHHALDAVELVHLADAQLGDLGYVAPEVIADPNHHAGRADLYALGCVFYEALSGRSPFPAA